MAAEVKILIEGYTNADTKTEIGEEKTQPTVTLVIDGELTMVVDPGVMESQQILVNALSENNLNISDVNVVCVTHSHLDHYRNVGMFPDAKILEFFGLWDKNTVEDWKKQLSPNVQIVRTPGHDYTDITIFVTTENGIVAICGDVFWKENYPENPKDDAYALDPELLKTSRRIVLKAADWIIPGHGPMFKSKKNGYLQESRLQLARSRAAEPVCRKCRKPLKPSDKCLCRSWLCFNCCECGIDCNLCSCSTRARKDD